jgi:4-hydroxybenzoate polyprenyltransferase
MPMSKNIVGSLRISHWYKNLLAFLGLIFDRKVLELPLLAHALLVFFLLCLVSSSNYIINDLVDKKQDTLNQIKQQSLFARIDPWISIGMAVALFVTSITISIWLVPGVVVFLVLIAVLGQFYNAYAKNVPVLDVIVLLFMYLSRIYAGYISLEVVPYSLIVLPIAMLALFLVFIKKRSTLLILGENKAIEFRKSYSFYTLKRNDAVIMISGIGMATVYLLYVAINEKFNRIILLLTIPAVFALILTAVKSTRNTPELGIFLFKILKKKLILVASLYIVALYIVNIIFF